MQQLNKRINALEKNSHAKKVFLLYPHQQGMTEQDRQIARQNAWQNYLSEGGDPHVGYIYTFPIRGFNPNSKNWYYAN